MTQKEADIILLEVLLQTSNSGVDYFRIKAKEGNHDEVIFYKDLWEAYKRIEQHVNIKDELKRGWDKNGNETAIYFKLYLSEYTQGRMTGSFGRENLSELKEPLDEFGKSLMENIQSNIKKELMKITIQSNVSKEKPGAKSFTWAGSQTQKQALCEALNDAGYIHPETTKEAFTAIFANELRQCEPVQWTASNRLLSYLFSQMYGRVIIHSQDWQSIIEKFKLFKNRNGKFFKAGDLSTALSNINDDNFGLNPKGSEKIDAILETLRQVKT